MYQDYQLKEIFYIRYEENNNICVYAAISHTPKAKKHGYFESKMLGKDIPGKY